MGGGGKEVAGRRSGRSKATEEALGEEGGCGGRPQESSSPENRDFLSGSFLLCVRLRAREGALMRQLQLLSRRPSTAQGSAEGSLLPRG